MFHDHLDYFQSPPLSGHANTKPWDHNTPNTHNFWFIIRYHVWRPRMNKKFHQKEHLVDSPVTYGFTQHLRARDPHAMDSGGVSGRPLDTFLLGSHNFMVTALGSSAKWPQASTYQSLMRPSFSLDKSSTWWIVIRGGGSVRPVIFGEDFGH